MFNKKNIFIKIKAGWIQRKIKLEYATCDQSEIFNICKHYLSMLDRNIGIYQVQVTAISPIQKDIQADFFSQKTEQNNYLNAIDSINEKFGKDTIKLARLKLDRYESPDVIAPAWRPSGYRKSV